MRQTIKVKDVLSKLQELDPEMEVLTMSYDGHRDEYYLTCMDLDDFDTREVQRTEHNDGSVSYGDAIDVEATNERIIKRREEEYNRKRELKIYTTFGMTPLYKELRQPNKTVFVIRGG